MRWNDIGPGIVIIRLITILTLLSPGLLGWGIAQRNDRPCCEPRSAIEAGTEHCSSPSAKLGSGCGGASAARHACCSGAPECACGVRALPERQDAPKAPLPSRGDRDASATPGVMSSTTVSGIDPLAALEPMRPASLVIFTALRTHNDALAFLSVWRN